MRYRYQAGFRPLGSSRQQGWQPLPQMTATLRHPAILAAMHHLPKARIYASWDDETKGELHGQQIALE
ncbi:MAG: hypothetical protein Q7J44_10225 [Pseudotabrizicola sp.]|uniref:hypothetical protein n=1 Tax=Pseudotabrizicola sp. TaxID=2939647 RepID=UPI0027221F8D|nr:hypothetical protein [Pseudotabrizicola sp.]MDO9638907.1 hypothetical protein [Pseudotabrizicola sp.]